MSPTNFPQSNCSLGPPGEYDTTDIAVIDAYRGQVQGGRLDGSNITVVAWKPDEQDLEKLQRGEAVFLAFIDIAPMHTVTVGFPAE